MAPMLRTDFFLWYMAIPTIRQTIHATKSDWGNDFVWCGAAKSFIAEVLSLNATKRLGCAIYTQGIIKHGDFKTEVKAAGYQGMTALDTFRVAFPYWWEEVHFAANKIDSRFTCLSQDCDWRERIWFKG